MSNGPFVLRHRETGELLVQYSVCGTAQTFLWHRSQQPQFFSDRTHAEWLAAKHYGADAVPIADLIEGGAL